MKPTFIELVVKQDNKFLGFIFILLKKEDNDQIKTG